MDGSRAMGSETAATSEKTSLAISAVDDFLCDRIHLVAARESCPAGGYELCPITAEDCRSIVSATMMLR
jgi:hypothetical protein